MRARSRTLEKAIVQGTTRMRTHVEVDPRVGLNGFHAVTRAQARLRLGDRPRDLRISAGRPDSTIPAPRSCWSRPASKGADVIGGCPYTDSDPHGQIARIFAIARRFDLDIDFHLDFDLDPSWMHLDEVCRQTDAHRWGGRVAIGHVTKLSAPSTGRACDAIARAAGRCRRRRHGAAGDRPVPDGARAPTINVPRGVAPAHRLLDAWRDLLARDQQRAQSVHAVRRLLADPHGQPLCQYRAARPRRRAARLLRHGHHAAGAADECSPTTASRSAIPPTSSCSTAAIRRWRWPSSRNRCSATSAADAASPTPPRRSIIRPCDCRA